MSFSPSLALRYIPTIGDILDDMAISDSSQIAQTILSKCESLYHIAEKTNNIELFGSSHEFILCDSVDFYQTFVNCGYGNAAMVISDDKFNNVYFLMFKDKIPSRFRPIVAVHESTEYRLISERSSIQPFAHEDASRSEMRFASLLSLKDDYLSFVQKEYPGKFDELKRLNLL